MKEGWERKSVAKAIALVVSASAVMALADPDTSFRLGAAIETNRQFKLTLTGESSVSYVIESAPDLQNWSPVVTNNVAAFTRTIFLDSTNGSSFYRASRGPVPTLFAALAALRTIDLQATNIFIDSFDSSDPNYSSGAQYDPTKNKDGGDAVTVSNSNNIVKIGNALIMGHVQTGPGGTWSIEPTGSVGSKAWVQGANTGIQPGYASDDMIRAFPDVQYPNYIYGFPTWMTSLPAGGTVDGQTYNHVVSNNGFYQISGNSFSGSIYLGTNANAVIWITSSVNNFSNLVTIAPEGATLRIYLASTFTERGNGNFNNTSEKAQNLYLFGLPTCTSINLAGDGNFTGVIYAPEATLNLGTNTTAAVHVLTGACMGKNIFVTGNVNFHFDENLKQVGPTR